MARPRTIKLPDGGEVVLRNVAPEDADRIKSLVLGTPLEVTAPSGETEQVDAVYTHTALGMFKEGNSWKVLVAAYNPLTQDIRVEEVVDCGDRAVARERFKILTIHKGVI